MSSNPNPFPLGRIPSPDERDKAFPMRSALPSRIAAAYRDNAWKLGPVLDQSGAAALCPLCLQRVRPHYPHCCEQGTCVGHAWQGFLEAKPVRSKSAPGALDIYHGAQKRDTWSGEEYSGTSVRGGVKYLQDMGHIESYVWANDAQTVADFVRTKGTVVIGIQWPESAFYPLQENGYILDMSGRIVGGHALLISWFLKRYRFPVGEATFRTVKNVFVLRNSWSGSWGKDGNAYLRAEDLDRFLHDDGEACAALQRAVG
jgi:hypothetical protein